MNEQQIEQALIEKLDDLKYSYRSDICDRVALEQNFRQHFEALHRVNLTDSEFHRLLDSFISTNVFTAARHLREPNSFERDDGTPLFYTLVNLKDWCKNSYEVINQLRINTASSHHRYDVILLINGVPVVQIELKNLPISPCRAMQQIVDYKNDPGNSYTNTLLCFIQLFIVSNQNDTYYFANNNCHFRFNADERFLPVYQFAAEDNKKITHLHDFAEKFLAKCILGEMIDRYMVLVASEQKLMMMRPYQIYAVKNIVECIHQNCGNGYIWHTTGSGKTLTSFKASTLLKKTPDIEKCLFVVDRKDLDRQTREEFNKFQKDCVEENTNKEFFPNAQLFGFTGTPIFEENASYQRIEDQQASYITTEDIFQKQLHAYTITHAIEDRNVLRFHIDYYKPEGKSNLGETIAKQAIVEAILTKHDAATAGRKFNAILATASINDAIAYYDLFKIMQVQKQVGNPEFQPLNIACVFSRPPRAIRTCASFKKICRRKKPTMKKPQTKRKPLSGLLLPTTMPAMARITALTNLTHIIRMFKGASRISNTPIRTCRTRRRST
jgi:type I site-specific restriction-modification system R (restriction) subunit